MTRRSFLLAACLSAAIAAPAVAQKVQYRARLSTVPIDVAMQATVAGAGSVTATLDGTKLAVAGGFTGLRSAATVARLHRGPRTAMRGPAIAELKVAPGTSGNITGTFELTKELVEDLAAGRLYIQLHSEQAPEGNLWGWFFVHEGRK